MKVVRKLTIHSLTALALLTACSPAKSVVNVEVTNPLDFSRKEIVTLKRDQLGAFLKVNKENLIRVKNESSGAYLPIQWIDYENDGIGDELLFQAEVAANASAKFTIVADSATALPESKTTTYSRFVPERTDDYTWENDKVAFRTYGPDAQQRTEQKRENGTLSSGIDLWLKRTDKPVINKWYAGYKTDPNFYHKDHGEGYDPYHVGASRGTGGTGVLENDRLLVSKNFVTHKTIAEGPLKTVFELTYAPWSNYNVHETKRISLDLGSNFSKFEIDIVADKPVPNYTVGITLHNNQGEAKLNEGQGWFMHQELIDGSFIGEGFVIDPTVIDRAFVNKSKTPDQSNLLVVSHPKGNKITYYAGFAWQKSGQVANAADWEAMLIKQAQIVANPLKVTVK